MQTQLPVPSTAQQVVSCPRPHFWKLFPSEDAQGSALAFTTLSHLNGANTRHHRLALSHLLVQVVVNCIDRGLFSSARVSQSS